MVKSNVYYLKRLINHQFPRAYRRIVSRLEGEEFAVEDVQLAFEQVKAQNAALDYLKNSQFKHELTQEIGEMRNARHQHLLSLRGRVLYCLKSPIAEEQAAAKVLEAWLGRESGFLRARSIHGQAQSIHSLIHSISLSSPIGEALGTLGLLPVIEALDRISDQIDLHHSTRQDDKLAAAKEANEMRRVAYDAMQTFVVAIEQAISLNKGDREQHVGYLIDINTVVTDFYRLHLSRLTRRKNAAGKTDADNSDMQEGGDQEVTHLMHSEPTSTKTVMRKRPYSVFTLDVMDNDLQNRAQADESATDADVAMTGSLTRGEPLDDGDVTKAEEAAADNGEQADDALKNNANKDEFTKGHDSATTNEDDSDHES